MKIVLWAMVNALLGQRKPSTSDKVEEAIVGYGIIIGFIALIVWIFSCAPPPPMPEPLPIKVLYCQSIDRNMVCWDEEQNKYNYDQLLQLQDTYFVCPICCDYGWGSIVSVPADYCAGALSSAAWIGVNEDGSINWDTKYPGVPGCSPYTTWFEPDMDPGPLCQKASNKWEEVRCEYEWGLVCGNKPVGHCGWDQDDCLDYRGRGL